MKGQKKKQNGITLIALVISIIVMLILAGVSLNAVLGDNGILKQAQFASFMSEMAAVEEAVQLWGTQHYDDENHSIPTGEIVSTTSLDSSERLKGEVGYYRKWSVNESMPTPTTIILSDPNSFNNDFSEELVYYPGGVEDLYYLDNDVLNLTNNKRYLIDAVNSMIYSEQGISLNGVRCYSSAMAKAVMNGVYDMPSFASSEVSGSSSGKALAGNSRYKTDANGTILLDADGKPIENENYDPNGFKIIASPDSNNIFKLYNTGELYGKGVKGIQLQNSKTELDSINPANWTVFEVPSSIGGYKKIIPGYQAMYVIDNNNQLWAWGENGNANRFGLTDEEKIEYTNRVPIKLNVGNGKEIKKVFDCGNVLIVITIQNEVFAMGDNFIDWLGLGYTSDNLVTFKQLDIPNVINIKNIQASTERGHIILVQYNDNTYYACGQYARNLVGDGTGGAYKKFVPIWNGKAYVEDSDGNYVEDQTFGTNGYNSTLDIDGNIKQVIVLNGSCIVLKNDGTLWYAGLVQYIADDNFQSNYLRQFTGVSGVDSIYPSSYGFSLLKTDGTVYGVNYITNDLGLGGPTSELEQIELPDDLVSSGIKEIYGFEGARYYLSKDNELYGSASNGTYIGLSYTPEEVVKLNAPEMSTLYPSSSILDMVGNERSKYSRTNPLFLGKDGNLYSIGNATVLFGDKILQKTWKLVASGVVNVAIGEDNAIAYIDSSKNLYVAGSDSRKLGLGKSKQEPIYTFTQVDDININEKARDVQFCYGQMYVLTTGKVLYATGLYSIDGGLGWPNGRNPGWSDLKNNYDLVEILPKVTAFRVRQYNKMAVSDGILKMWGMNADNELGIDGRGQRAPVTKDLSSLFDVDDIAVLVPNSDVAIIIDTDGKIYACSRTNYQLASSFAVNANSWEDVTSLFGNEEIVNSVTMNRTANITLTSTGKVYAFGNKQYIGEGTNNTILKEPTETSLSDITQIAAGNGFFVCVSKDGKVYGTGSNTYGILGRWKGAPRTAGKYRTAYSWVECPELEI